MKKNFVLSLTFFSLALLTFFAACSGKESPKENKTETVIETPMPGPAWPALALLKTGEHPLWFELGPDGPSHIESPAAASLTPFSPWPQGRNVTGMQVWDNFIVMAVNRFGFLVLGAASEPKEAVLYQAADSALWDSYTTESFFVWDDKPAVLIYRNDFFSGLSAPPPASQVYVLSKTSPVPLAATVPALSMLLPSREAEVLRRRNDGFWYYRVKEKTKAQNDTFYYRTGDLSTDGTRISVTDWRNSDQREANPSGADDGNIYFSLPVLPDGFIYSGVSRLGGVLAASWEEQLDAGIGAAGFMVMALDAH